MSNGIDLVKCFNTVSQEEEFQLCRDDTQDNIDEICQTEDLDEPDCACVESTCINAINEFINDPENGLGINLTCEKREMVLCPLNTFRADDINSCIAQFSATELETAEINTRVCECVFKECGDLVDLPTFLTISSYVVIVVLSLISIATSYSTLKLLRKSAQLRHWLFKNAKNLGASQFCIKSFFAVNFFLVLAHIIVIFVSSSKDYFRTIDILNNSQFFREGSATVSAVLAFISIVQGERVWIDVAYETERYWNYKLATARLTRVRKGLKIIQGFVIATTALGIILDLAGVSATFKEIHNLFAGFVMTFLAGLTLFTRWKFLSVVQGNDNGQSTSIKKAAASVDRVSKLVFLCSTGAAIGFFLDTVDALDYANYSEADYAFLLVTVMLTLSQTGLQLYSFDRIRTMDKYFKNVKAARDKSAINTQRRKEELATLGTSSGVHFSSEEQRTPTL